MRVCKQNSLMGFQLFVCLLGRTLVWLILTALLLIVLRKFALEVSVSNDLIVVFDNQRYYSKRCVYKKHFAKNTLQSKSCLSLAKSHYNNVKWRCSGNFFVEFEHVFLSLKYWKHVKVDFYSSSYKRIAKNFVSRLKQNYGNCNRWILKQQVILMRDCNSCSSWRLKQRKPCCR